MPSFIARSCVLVLALTLCVSATYAQQANTANAIQRINGVETGSGPMAAIADPCSGLAFVLSSGQNPSMPFSIFSGPVLPTGINLGAAGIVDLNFTSPSFVAVMDGIFQAFAPPVLNAMAQTDLGGNFALNAGLGFGLPSTSFGFQTLMADPTNPSGVQLTAATNVTIVSGAQGGTLSPPADGAVTQAFSLGFTFTYYGVTYTQVNVAENGVLGFGSLANLQAATGIPAGATQPVTNSTGFLGTAGVPTPPMIGFFEHLSIAANGGAGSILYSESPTQFSVSWCNVAVTQGGGNSSLTVILNGNLHPTNPGRIELLVTIATPGTLGNGRVWGLTPGGTGGASFSPTTAGINVSAVSRNIQAGGANAGFVATNAMSAIFESFNFAWGADPVNPVFDINNVTMRFDPATPGAGPYTLRALSEAALTLNGVSPSAASLAGGAAISISGRGFRNDGTTSAALGAAAVSGLTYVNSETLTGTIPPAPGGTAQIVNAAVTVGSLPATATLVNGFNWSAGPLNGSLPLTDEEFATYTFDPNIFGTFDLYGSTWNNIRVHANGHAMMALTQPVSGAANFISDPPTFNGFANVTMAPLFNDLCHTGCTGVPNAGDVTTVETSTSVTIRWNNWRHWANLGGPLTFSLVLDKNVPGFHRVVFDYSASPAAPNPNLSQPGGASGIIVGMKPAGAANAAPRDFLAAHAGGLSQGVNATLFHWEASATYVGGILSSGGTSNWDFGTAAVPGPVFNRTIVFTPVNAPTNSDFIITLQ